MFLKVSIGLAILAASVTAASAKSYDCAIKTTEQNHGWIADRIFLERDAKDAVQVLDGIIQYENKAALPGKIESENTSRVVYSWRVKIDNSQPVTMMYRLAVRSDNTAMVTARPLNYDNTFEAQGTCTVK